MNENSNRVVGRNRQANANSSEKRYTLKPHSVPFLESTIFFFTFLPLSKAHKTKQETEKLIAMSQMYAVAV